mgnify:CR=1 FL=1
MADFHSFDSRTFQSTLPARGATGGFGQGDAIEAISIHAPRTGSDLQTKLLRAPRLHFNPRSPHGERQSARDASRRDDNFNPRSPHGERPSRDGRGAQRFAHFNPRSPHGERLQAAAESARSRAISIHAPRTGSDHLLRCRYTDVAVFQSTLPARGATCRFVGIYLMVVISIHAPRMGSDAIAERETSVATDFNPRSPHGERPRISCTRCGTTLFQSTLPARGATVTAYK